MPQKHQLLIEFEDNSFLVYSIQIVHGALWALKEDETESYNECALRSKPTPLSDAFDEKYFRSLYQEADKKLSVKAFLATNQRIPGLGNGVLQDILFNAKVHPKRKMSDLSDCEFMMIYNSIKETLLK